MAEEAAVTTIRSEPFKEHVIRLMKKIETIPQSSMEVFLWDLLHLSIGDLRSYRYFQLSVKNVPDPGTSLGIRIVADRRANTLSIIDGGYGRDDIDLMSLIIDLSNEDVKLFEKCIDECLMKGDDPSAYYEIEGICLGVYAAFMVANRVVITSKPADDKQVYVWESHGLNHGGGSASGSYTITRRAFDAKTTLPRGTTVTLYLKDEHVDKYLDLDKLVSLVHLLKYHDHCPYTIEVLEVLGEGKPIKFSGGMSFIDKSEDMQSLLTKFEPLRKVCAEILEGYVTEVVITDRVYDLPVAMEVGSTKFEINPRHHSIQFLLKAYEEDPDGVREGVEDTFQLHYHLLLTQVEMRESFVVKNVYQPRFGVDEVMLGVAPSAATTYEGASSS